MNFKYVRDKQYFVDILCDGDIDVFEKSFRDYFDFRDPEIKRKEFNLIRDKMNTELFEKYFGKCQLQMHPDCKVSKEFEIDHIIPLSSNQLNKKIRKVKAVTGKKVPSQPFGSNHKKNLILACKRCNAFKKNKIIPFRKTSNGIKFLH